MNENKEVVADDASAIVGMFFLAITMPIWLPILIIGFALLAPLMLIYVALDDMNAQRAIEKENQK